MNQSTQRREEPINAFRLAHIKLMQAKGDTTFYQRQKENKPTVSPAFEQEHYFQQSQDSHLNLAELQQVERIQNSIKALSLANQQALIKVLQQPIGDKVVSHRDYLRALRSLFHEFCQNRDNSAEQDVVNQLIQELFQQTSQDFLKNSDSDFKVSIEIFQLISQSFTTPVMDGLTRLLEIQYLAQDTSYSTLKKGIKKTGAILPAYSAFSAHQPAELNQSFSSSTLNQLSDEQTFTLESIFGCPQPNSTIKPYVNLLAKSAHEEFRSTLIEEIKAYGLKQTTVQDRLKEKEDKRLSLFISYAWATPNTPTYEQDYAYQCYVEKIAEDLEAAGFNILLNKWQDRRGAVLSEFVEKVLDEETDYMLVIGTPLYLQKYKRRSSMEQSKEHIVRLEGRLLNYLVSYSTKKAEHVIPVLLEGEAEQSLPPLLHPHLSVNLVKQSYFKSLFILIRDLYGINQRDKKYQGMVDEFKETLTELSNLTSYQLEQKYSDKQATKLAQKIKKAKERASRQIQKRLNSMDGGEESAQQKEANILHPARKDEAAIEPKTANQNQQSLIAWGIPMKLPYFVERSLLHEQIAAHCKDKKNGYILTVTALSGLGGVGKTQLANHYIHMAQNYTFKAWFKAESVATLQQDYWALAQRLQLIEEKDTPEQVNARLHQWFKDNPGWLLVYDNVDNYDMVYSLLPKEGGHLLITSRNQNSWLGVKHISVERMSLVEGLSLVRQLCKKEGEDIDKLLGADINKLLVEKLGLLPLAMVHAASYMRTCKMNAKDFLKAYDNNGLDFLELGQLPVGDYDKPIGITWSMNIRAIEKVPYAKEFLEYCSFLYHASMPSDLFKVLLIIEGVPEKEIEPAFGAIKSAWLSYSLVTLSEDTESISLHPVVRGFIVSQIKKENFFSRLVALLITLLTISQKRNQMMEDISRRQQLLKHLLTVLRAANGVLPDQNQIESKRLLELLIANILALLAEIYLLVGNMQEAIVM